MPTQRTVPVRCLIAAAALLPLLAACANHSTPSQTGSNAASGSAGATPSAGSLSAVTKPIDDLGPRHLATIPIDGSPDWPLVAYDSVWVSNSGTGKIQRFDPRTNTVTADVPITQPCNGLTSGGGAVWTGSCAGGGYVARIDPATNTIVATRQVALAADGEGQVAFGFGSLWVATGEGHLLRLDPRLAKVQSTIDIPAGASAALTDQDAVWVTSPNDAHLLRVDPNTNTVVGTYVTGGHPQFLTSGFGSIWTLNQGDGTVTRVDKAHGAATTIAAESPGEGGCITTGLGGVWLTIYTKPLTRIAPTTNTVTEQLTGQGGDCVITGFDSVWLTNNQIGSMYRIAPT
jgi:streptogramin lyase